MTVPELVRLAQAHLATLNGRRATAEALGDLGEIERLDAEISQTEATLQSLQSLA